MRLAPVLLSLVFATHAVASDFGREMAVSTSVLQQAAGRQDYPSTGSNGTDFLVTWWDGRPAGGLFASRVSGSGEVLDPKGIALGAVGLTVSGPIFPQPQIFTSDGVYTVIWISANAITLARVDRDGNVVTPARTLANNLIVYGSRYAAFDGSNIAIVYVRLFSEPRVLITTPAGDVLRDESLPTRPPNNYNYTIASNGSEFLIAWNQSTQAPLQGIDGVRMSSDGAFLDAPDSLLPPNMSAYDPVISSDGNDFLLLFGLGLTVERITASRALGDPHRVAGAYNAATIVWTGTQYVALTNSGGAVVPLDRDGQPTSDPKPLAHGGSALAVANGKALIAWSDSHLSPPNGYETDMFAALTDTTAWLPSEGKLLAYSAPSQQSPSIAFSGSNYLVTWTENGALLAGRVGVDGAILDGRGITVADDAASAVSFNGEAYVIAWVDRSAFMNVATVTQNGTLSAAPRSSEQCGGDISMASGPRGETLITSGPCAFRVDRAGNFIGAPLHFTSQFWRNAVAAWNGSEYLIAWNEPIYYGVSQFPRLVVRAARVSDALVLIDPSPIDVAVKPSDFASAPSVASDGNGFLVVYSNYNSQPDAGVHARHISASGAVVDDLIISPMATPLVTWDGARYFVSVTNARHATGVYVRSSRDPLPDDAKDIASDIDSAVPAVRIGNGAVAVAYSRAAADATYAGADRVFIRAMSATSRQRAIRPQALASGWWTAPGAAFFVKPDGTVDFSGPCASGSFGRPQLVAQKFAVSGFFGVEIGPAMPPLTAATYRGVMIDDQLRLDIDTAAGNHFGPWLFDFDGPQPKKPRPVPCV